MTIKEFARLCGCSTQTLRYYDKIDLLKPEQVDPWSGYRYYAAAQAIDFVKIKNLQAADFTIEEIRPLLTASDADIYAAFEEKIAVQKQKLERILEIQQSYLREKTTMELVIQSMSDFILRNLSNYEMLQEFGMTPEDGPQIVERIRGYLESRLRQDLTSGERLTLTINQQQFKGPEQIAEKLRSLTADNLADDITLNNNDDEEADFREADYDVVWEQHGWQHVRQFIDDIPALEKDREYCFCFKLEQEKQAFLGNDLSFPLFMLGVMTLKKTGTAVSMGCTIQNSPDNENHFLLLRKK